jgi:hypothetical protein
VEDGIVEAGAVAGRQQAGDLGQGSSSVGAAGSFHGSAAAAVTTRMGSPLSAAKRTR